MTDRTDAERFAWCAKHTMVIDFCEYRYDVIVTVENDKSDLYNEIGVTDDLPPIDAWRKCVDELMDRKKNS